MGIERYKNISNSDSIQQGTHNLYYDDELVANAPAVKGLNAYNGGILPVNQNKNEGTDTATILPKQILDTGTNPLVNFVADKDTPVAGKIAKKRILTVGATVGSSLTSSSTLPDLSSKPTILSFGYWVKDNELSAIFNPATSLMEYWLFSGGKYITFKFQIANLIVSIENSVAVTKAITGAGLINSFDCEAKCLAKSVGYSYVKVTLSNIIWNDGFTDYTHISFYQVFTSVKSNFIGKQLTIQNFTFLYNEIIASGLYVYGDGVSISQYPVAKGLQLQTLDLFRFNRLYGKSIATAGDSITEGTDPAGGFFESYGQLIAERNGMTCYNYGISGSTMTNIVGKNPFTGRWNTMDSNLDYILLWFGWNDGAYATLGTINDAVDTTFYGAWNYVLPLLINKYPLAKIGIIVPYMGEAPFKQAVREIAIKWGLPYLDMDNEQTPLVWLRDTVDDTIAQLRRSTFTYDGTHPNQSGHQYISTFVEDFIRRL